MKQGDKENITFLHFKSKKTAITIELTLVKGLVLLTVIKKDERGKKGEEELAKAMERTLSART